MKRFLSPLNLPLCLLLSLVAQSALAKAPLLGGAALASALKDKPACCVIDARTLASRTAAPLPASLPYQPGQRINPTSTVVVVADSDEQALKIASALQERYSGKPVIAVKGGLKVWQALTAASTSTPARAQAAAATSTASANPKDGAPVAGVQFVIPLNTCENGEPLQTLQSSQK